ncbi:hypothetical protein [Alloacidobacterium sp.]|uniref:hypothetical protein n=1 Tax=Alloacidobacterium sp. TaxID=2951999 RepID=UPI002D6F99BD|nr:hypothetical protein [Alloacidobacterium sp.]HYK37274.1 hypothetical protein [Alloacidobacterium sp.]
MENEGLIPTQQFLHHLRNQRERIVSIHLELSQLSDGGMASAMYQDGLLHAFDDVLSTTVLGIKRSEDFEGELREAGKAVKQARKDDNVIEIAYWSGRFEVVERFCDRDVTSIPAYFHPYKMAPVARFVKGRKF